MLLLLAACAPASAPPTPGAETPAEPTTILGDLGDQAGWSVTAAGDMDGDGQDDVLLGAPSSRAQSPVRPGAAYVVLGPIDDGEHALPEAAAAFWGGQEHLDDAGLSVAAGDFDGQGARQIAVGAVWNDTTGDNRGAIYIDSYAPGGHALAEASVRLYGAGERDALGYTLVTPGDVDGDGTDDLLVASASSTYLLLAPGSLPSGALSDVAYRTWVGTDAAPTPLPHSGGDLDGDDLPDILVDSADGSGRGVIYLLFGPEPAPDLADADVTLAGEAEGDRAGEAATVGDVDGDGHDDLVVSAYDHVQDGAAGTFYILHGPLTAASSLSTADARLVNDEPTVGAGGAVQAGDLDADGRADLALYRGWLDQTGWPTTSEIDLVLSPIDGVEPLSDVVHLAQSGGNEVTFSDLEPGGDVDADGLPDLLIGEQYYDPDYTGSGRVVVLANEVLRTCW